MYQLLQLSPQVLKMQRREAQTKREKQQLLLAMILRSVLLILFAMVYISFFSFFFGQENVSVGVGSFCILLGARFVSYGYNIKESLLSMGLVFLLMFVSSLSVIANHPWIGLVVHFLSLLIILVVTANEPKMGNAGIYVFTYLFVSASPVSGTAIFSRAVAFVYIFFLCGGIFYKKHKGKFEDCGIQQLVNKFHLNSKLSQWQLRLAGGVSFVLFIGQALNLPKAVWMGYACMSVLLPYENRIRERLAGRMGGILLGSFLYGLFSLAIPKSFTPMLAPLAGIFLGFCATYFWTTVFNCFGALTLASSIYGLGPAIIIRVQNNFIGGCVALISLIAVEYIMKNKRKNE